MLSSNRNKFSTINTALKYIVSIAAFLYIGYRVTTIPFSHKDFLSFFDFPILCIITLLTIGNWSFEILKWKIVINTFSSISFKEASYQTLVAYTYGLLTPFNSGNYAKKIFFFPKEDAQKVVFLNLSKGVYQMITTLLFGSWGVYVLIDEINFSSFNQQHFLIFTGIIGIVSVILFRKKLTPLMRLMTLKTHFKLFLYSVIKFLFFSSVLIVLLHKNGLPEYKLYAAICSIYLLSSLLPILNILDFAIKGSVALWILPPLGYDQKNILIAYFILWICNHATPAILGSILQFYSSKKDS